MREVDRLDGWLRELLLYARADQPAEPGTTDFAAAVRAALDGLGPALARRGVALELELEDRLPSVPGGQAPLAHVVDTLVNNALDAMPGGGRLRVSARAGPGRREAELRDRRHGRGRAARAAARQFPAVRHHQARRARPRPGAGPGGRHPARRRHRAGERPRARHGRHRAAAGGGVASRALRCAADRGRGDAGAERQALPRAARLRGPPLGRGGGRLEQFERFKPDVVLLDLNLPDASGLDVLARLRRQDARVPVVLITAYGSVQAAVDAMKAGASDFLTKPLALGEVKRLLDRLVGQERLQGRCPTTGPRRRTAAGWTDPRPLAAHGGAEGADRPPARRRARSSPSRAARGPGAGRDRAPARSSWRGRCTSTARAAPRRSSRSTARRCRRTSSSPSSSATSAAPSPTRASASAACSRRPHGGTLFLDEIGDLPPALQAKLLRCSRIGRSRASAALRDRRVDVRFVAATNRPLEALVAEGRFRADLFFRLSVVTLRLPPLRERGDDILVLAEHFLDLHARATASRGSCSARRPARPPRHSWPGNVRELRNAMEQAALSATGEVVGPEHLSLLHQPAAPRPTAGPPGLVEVERGLIADALAREGGNVTRAARALGISRDTLRYRMEKHGLRSEP